MKTISVEDLKQRMDKQKDGLLLLDARGDEAFEEEHIPHAKSAPETALRERIEGLVQKESEIIVYCTDEDCKMSRRVGNRLEEMGYENVATVPAGIEGWRQAGHDTETN
jgi:rhodanese-related sulfurtransferase